MKENGSLVAAEVLVLADIQEHNSGTLVALQTRIAISDYFVYHEIEHDIQVSCF